MQVLGTVAIVSKMNAIQVKLASHSIPRVHLLIPKNKKHTSSPERDLHSWTCEHAVNKTFIKSKFLDGYSEVLPAVVRA